MHVRNVGEKGSLWDRLRYGFYRRKRMKKLVNELTVEEREKILEEDLRKKNELQFILIRNRFMMQHVRCVDAKKDLPPSDLKIKVITASQVALTGMGLVAMGLSGKSSDEAVLMKKGDLNFGEKKDKDAKESDVCVKNEHVDVLDEKLPEAALNYQSSSLIVDKIQNSQMQLEHSDKKLKVLEDRLDQALYAEDVSFIQEGHEDVKPVLKRVDCDFNEAKEECLKDFSISSDLKEKDSVSFHDESLNPSMVVFGKKDFLQLKLVRDHSYFLDTNIDKCSKKIEKRDRGMQWSRKKTLQVDDFNSQLSSELVKQTQYFNALKDRIAFADKNYDIDFKLKATGSLIGNIFKLSMGILTLPFGSKNKVGSRLLIGSVLIHHALKGLNVNIFGDKNTYIYQEYRKFLRELSEGKSELEIADALLSDSLSDICLIREEFLIQFQEYCGKLPEYDEILRQINEVEESLKKKQEVFDRMKDELDCEYKKNKVKVKKMEGF